MSSPEAKLRDIFHRLPDSQQQQLLEYAEFLDARHGITPSEAPGEPLDIPRPEQESVVKAIRRLSQTYPMLDTRDMLHKTSSFMMRTVVHGEDSSQVIDEMEVYFRECYEKQVGQRDDS